MLFGMLEGRVLRRIFALMEEMAGRRRKLHKNFLK
jgi:hypothetical protein